MLGRKSVGMVLALLAAAGVVSVIVASIIMPQSFARPYWVIQTPSTVYIAQIHSSPFSPFLALNNVYIYVEQQDTNKQVHQSLNPIDPNALWGSHRIYLNRDQVVFKTAVEKNSQIYATLCGQADASLRPAGCPAPVPQPQPAPAAPAPAPTPAPAK